MEPGSTRTCLTRAGHLRCDRGRHHGQFTGGDIARNDVALNDVALNDAALSAETKRFIVR